MAKIETITVSATRKVSANYNTREVGASVTLTPEADENPKTLTQTWSRRLQALCDQELGDVGQPASFSGGRTSA